MLSFVDCAKKGTPSGGPRDTIPPMMVKSSPENFSINFTGNEIVIRFNEYIKLKDVNKELIISPPMKYSPLITPLSASKMLKIKILDTLKENTTYSFNFGNSIVDNNEENKLEYFKYIFSTGNYIDSLKLSGNVKDAQLIAPEIPTSVVLYEVNENFTDSLVYSEKPTYITTTKDSTGTFELTNVKEGKYLLLALKENNSDYTFQPKTDKIGFVENLVNLPADTTYSLTLFKEIPEYKLARPSQLGQNHILFGYEGIADSLEINLLSELPQDFSVTTFREFKKDTLHYFFKPSVENDSLLFTVKNAEHIDTLTVRMKELYKDSLRVLALNKGTQKLLDTLKLRANTPLRFFDPEQMQVIAKDSSLVIAEGLIDKKYNTAGIYFPKTEDQSYNVQLLPGALTDYFGNTNDTLHFNVNTRLASDYGTLNLELNNVASFPVIVQLVDSKYRVVAESYLEENAPIYFEELSPAKYFLRLIYDVNKNKRWDTGNFLERRAPEKIIYYPTEIEIRANWGLNEIFTLK